MFLILSRDITKEIEVIRKLKKAVWLVSFSEPLHFTLFLPGRKVKLHTFLTSELDGDERSASRSGCFVINDEKQANSVYDVWQALRSSWVQ